MAYKRISELPAALELYGSELVPLVQGGVTKYASLSELRKAGAETLETLRAFYVSSSPFKMPFAVTVTGTTGPIYVNDSYFPGPGVIGVGDTVAGPGFVVGSAPYSMLLVMTTGAHTLRAPIGMQVQAIWADGVVSVQTPGGTWYSDTGFGAIAGVPAHVIAEGATISVSGEGVAYLLFHPVVPGLSILRVSTSTISIPIAFRPIGLRAFSQAPLTEQLTLHALTGDTLTEVTFPALSSFVSAPLSVGTLPAGTFVRASIFDGDFIDLDYFLVGYFVSADEVSVTEIKFIELSDAPHSYAGFGGKAVVVNETEDGLEFGLAPGGGTGEGLAYDVGLFCEGRPEAGETVLRFVVVRAFELAASLTGSRAHAEVATSAPVVFSVRKNGVQFGTVNFAGASQTATFTAAAPTALAVGDRLTVVAPFTQDPALADVSITLAGTRI
jgi:hypothetical protein